MENKILIFGHKSPDTDTICSAIVMAEIQKGAGKNVEPVRLGEINKETKYVLEYFNVEVPRLINSVEEDQEVILVDHNEFQQSVDGIENAKILTVVDHHRINDFVTKDPLFYYAEPVGCTATILYKICKMNNIEISKKMAGLMCSCIISDTLLFKSATCTPIDKKVAEELSKIAELNLEEYGLNMLKAGTDLDDFSEKELLELDSKNVSKNNVNIVISQVNTVSIEDVFKRQEKLESAMQEKINKDNLDLLVLAVTDILNANTEILVLGNRASDVEKVGKLENNRLFLKGVTSRKKQILPMIDECVN